MSPVGVFSNLLNAYATMDSKHDLTEKLISGATSLFRGGEENIVEENTDDEAQAKDGEVTEPTPSDNQVFYKIISQFMYYFIQFIFFSSSLYSQLNSIDKTF